MRLTRREFVAGITAAVAHAPKFARGLSSIAPQLAPAALASDPRRPQYHFLPPANWMNDPNGPIYWMGEYHLFYQYNPGAPVWGDMHWGHAVSEDMVHWRHLPPALSPTPGGPDAAGCFTGSAIVRDGAVSVVYTGVTEISGQKYREVQCLATSSDPDLRTWVKSPIPLIPSPPAQLDTLGFRDPSAWRAGRQWYMTVGSGLRNQGGAVLLYRSNDFLHWDYLCICARGEPGKTGSGNPVHSGDMWECPELFPLGNKHVLIYSTAHKAYWQTGELDLQTMVFHPEHSGLLDEGAFYAPKTQLDRSGNRIMWGFVPEQRPLADYKAAGWACMMSLPRLLTLDQDGSLKMMVAPALTKLRGKEQIIEPTSDEIDNHIKIDSLRIQNCCGELLITLDRKTVPIRFDLVNRASGESLLSFSYDPALPGEIVVNQRRLLIARSGSRIEISSFIDGSAVETFIDRRSCFTRRFYYRGERAPELGIAVTGKASGIRQVVLWQMTPISADRLTT